MTTFAPVRILGLSAFYHDSAAAILVDGKVMAAAQEERFSRKKNDSSFPRSAIAYCLSEAKLEPKEIGYVAFYEKPFLKFERLLETYLAFAPRGFESFQRAMPIWLREKLYQKRLLVGELSKLDASIDWATRLLFAEHHQSHAASAFYLSPFEDAAVLTMDGVGEWATTSVGRGQGSELTILRELHFPHSVGLLYSAFAYYTGFKVNSGEYKVMGLAPYGEPRYLRAILEHLVDLRPDGTFRLNQGYFDYCTGLRMTNRRFHELFGGPPREEGQPLTLRHLDLAASVQAVTEEIVLRLARALAEETGSKNLCLAGGVALNCVANGKVLRDGCFERIWIQPAAGDAGGALGAAFAAYHEFLKQPRTADGVIDGMAGTFLGPAFDQADIELRLRLSGASFTVAPTLQAMIDVVVDALIEGNAVGWFQGRMEFGPRALGARSILADPRSPTMQKTLNLKVKHRESFRPFGPSVLRERVSEWFELDCDSPYMLLVANVVETKRRQPVSNLSLTIGIEQLNVPRSVIPAVTHVDYSARVQTVDRGTNPLYHELLSRFHQRTGCPVLVNTSFNVRGEPIVCTPEDALRCFMGTELDLLAIGQCLLTKSAQDPTLRTNYPHS